MYQWLLFKKPNGLGRMYTWEAQGYTFLHSGRPLPVGEGPAVRKEGVGIALDERATAAWKEAGQVWNAVSSRIVTARLKLTSVGQRRAGGSRETRSTHIYIISVYAPTARAPPTIQQKFMEDLQDAVSKAPASDVLLLLGDLNARVGSGRGGNSEWRGVRGRHGVGNCNEAGERLLEFCAINELTIMSTWFEKKQHHLTTWKHPATKQSHMIDYVIMRADQRHMCTDVQVMRGANCWSDHSMVRAVVRLQFPHLKKVSSRTLPLAVHMLQRAGNRESYEKKLRECLSEQPHDSSKSLSDNWRALKSCIVSAAEAAIGRGRKKQPEWFLDAADTLRPLLDQKNTAHNRFLQMNSVATKKEFRRCQRKVKRAVDAAKEEWISKVASEAEKAKKDGRQRWTCVRQLQMAYRGRGPRRPAALLKENGELTKSPDEVVSRWHRHFSSILNIPSEYDSDVIDRMARDPPHLEFDDPPTLDELLKALSCLKRGKAGGKTGILPELLLFGGEVLYDRLLKIMKSAWEAGSIPSDWKDAVVVPIPKKGNLRDCDNWRGISLLDVVGKVFARIIQERLQHIAEGILPESQCGFRRGRGCTDMIYAARQLVEKCCEHDDSLFMLFIDLKKAYDSVPRSALWRVLDKCGVPPTMLSIIQSFHDDMQAEVRVGDTTTEQIAVRNGLRQGCVLAPSLFNIYFGAMVAHWRVRCPEAGLMVRYKHGRKLVGDRTAKARLDQAKIIESQFADDAAVYATSREAFENATVKFVNSASKWGLTVSVRKTKGMVIGRHLAPTDSLPVQLDEGPVEIVKSFTYLGSNITDDGEVSEEVKCRIIKAARAFGCLRKAIFQNRHISVDTKRKVYRAAVLSVLLYGAETWTIKTDSLKRLSVFHNRCIRTIMGVTRYQQWKERLSSKRIAKACGMEETLEHLLIRQRLRWLGHLARMDPCRIPKQLLFGELEKKRPSHGTKRRWRDVVSSDLKRVDVSDGWYNQAQDRRAWKALCQDGIAGLVEQHHSGWLTGATPSCQAADTYPCSCGRVFKRRGDRTRHSRFCSSTDTVNP